MTAQAKTSFIKLQASSMPLYALLFGGRDWIKELNNEGMGDKKGEKKATMEIFPIWGVRWGIRE